MKKILVPFIIIPFLFLILVFNTYALEKTSGRIKLDLHEQTGRFSLSYLEDVSTGTYVPLLFAKDPETTTLYVSMDNKIYSMGDSTFFDQRVLQENSDTVSYIWESNQIIVTESFSLIKSVKSALTDGLKITITVKNVSEVTKKVGLSYLLDTYLGEKSKVHFKTDSNTVINSETYYTSNFPSYFVSPYDSSAFGGLEVMLKGPGITAPEKILFANWKRLKDNIGNYTVQNSRNFNLLPYSINDSAAALYYNQRSVAPGNEFKIILALGAYTGSFFQGNTEEEATSEINKLYIQTVETPDDTTNVEASLKTDLIAVEDLIAKIDEKLKYPEQVTAEEINLIRQIIDNLGQRKQLYEKR